MARDLDRYLLGGLILLTGAFALLGRAMDSDMCFEPDLILDEQAAALRDALPEGRRDPLR